MARKQRIHFTGATYHVILRGNNKQDIFFTEQDKFKLSLFLQEATEKYFCKILAFCFMSNHIHLAVQVEHIPLSRFIQNISFRYAK